MTKKSNKKLFIICAVLLLATVVLTFVYLVVDKSQSEKEYQKGLGTMVTQLYSFNDYDIDAISFNLKDGFFEFTSEDSSIWAGDVGFEHNDQVINNVVYNFSNLSSKGTITEDAKDLSLYGLDNPTVISAHNRETDEIYSLEVGDLSITQDFYYARKSDSNIIYKLSLTIGKIFAVTKNNLKSTYFFNVSSTEVNYMKLIREDELIFEAEKTESGWKLISPIEWIGNYSQLESTLNTVIRAMGQVYLAEDPENPEEFGFGEDFSECIAEFTIGSYDGKKRTAYFAAFNPQLQTMNGYFTDTKEVLQFYSGDVNFVYLENTGITDLYIYSENYMSDVNRVTVVNRGERTVIDISKNILEGDTLELKWGGKEILTEEDRDLTYRLYVALLDVCAESIEPDISTEISDTPEIEYIFRRNNDPQNVMISFYKRDDTTFYAFKDDKYTGLIVRLKEFEQPDRLFPVWEEARKNGFEIESID